MPVRPRLSVLDKPVVILTLSAKSLASFLPSLLQNSLFEPHHIPLLAMSQSWMSSAPHLPRKSTISYISSHLHSLGSYVSSFISLLLLMMKLFHFSSGDYSWAIEQHALPSEAPNFKLYKSDVFTAEIKRWHRDSVIHGTDLWVLARIVW
jgi:hypothetical protein